MLAGCWPAAVCGFHESLWTPRQLSFTWDPWRVDERSRCLSRKTQARSGESNVQYICVRTHMSFVTEVTRGDWKPLETTFFVATGIMGHVALMTRAYHKDRNIGAPGRSRAPTHVLCRLRRQ